MAVKRASIRGAVLSSAGVQRIGDLLAPFLVPSMQEALEESQLKWTRTYGPAADTPRWLEDLRQSVDSHRWVVQEINVTDSSGVQSEFGSAGRSDLAFVDGALAFDFYICAPYTYVKTPRVFLRMSGDTTEIEVQAADSDVANIFELLHKSFVESLTQSATHRAYQPPLFRVFIAYGGGRAWEVVRDYLRDAGYAVDAFTEDERAGQLTLDVVEEMIRTASVAVVVMTGADKMESGAIHARQNVVHEAGFAQGAIGRRNTIILREEGVTLPTNVDGLTYIQFAKGEIHTTRERVVSLVSRLQTQTNPASVLRP